MFRKVFAGLFFIFYAPNLWAESSLFVDTNLYYASDVFTTTASNTSTRLLYDFCVGFGATRSGRFLVGWNYSGHSFTDSTAGSTTTYASTQMGPRLVVYIDKDRRWRMSVAYNLQTSATYTAGSNPAEKWKGTGLGADFGYQFRMSDSFALGVRLSYSSTTYKESIVNETTYSTISYVRTYMYPSIAVTYEL
jgi:hypothetical protein